MRGEGCSVAVSLACSLLLLVACPSGRDDGTGATSNSGPSSVSNEDGPEPLTCEQVGGACSCAGSCDSGQVPSAEATCPQPPDESGACSQECCVPVGSTTAGSTAGSTADSAASSTADSTASSTAGST